MVAMSTVKNQKIKKDCKSASKDISHIFDLNSDLNLKRNFYIDFNLPSWYCNHNGNLLKFRTLNGYYINSIW